MIKNEFFWIDLGVLLPSSFCFKLICLVLMFWGSWKWCFIFSEAWCKWTGRYLASLMN